MKLRHILILKQAEIIPCILYFISIYLSVVEICKECLTRVCEKKHKIYTKLVGKKINSSLMMNQCWIMVVGFHNFLSSMTELKNNYKILPRPYVGSYEVEKGNQFLKKKYC